ncbi:hypothetical protein GCM10017674_15140 [Streptomyces gardneri]|uniref:Uncharacterized protein n=1 Tax=Streptomyces gardneri TaxID=66892 RepID=A0A4Y3RAA1_9ACTN|nr:hypothetical protein SGA01_02070 [Streptomyces gardneri]GHG88791.1 hypothetical protein GCM10017674_15140 [Streptomyces gardneri]
MLGAVAGLDGSVDAAAAAVRAGGRQLSLFRDGEITTVCGWRQASYRAPSRGPARGPAAFGLLPVWIADRTQDNEEPSIV